jgi:TRAP-type C4-dicarboxylate transport system permease small subunit
MFVWVTFVGAALLYRERLHVAVDMLILLLPQRGHRIAEWAIELVILIFNVILLIYGLKLSIDTLDQTYGALDITPATFYFAAPVAAGMMILFLLERIANPERRKSIDVGVSSTSI